MWRRGATRSCTTDCLQNGERRDSAAAVVVAAVRNEVHCVFDVARLLGWLAQRLSGRLAGKGCKRSIPLAMLLPPKLGSAFGGCCLHRLAGLPAGCLAMAEQEQQTAARVLAC